PDWVLAQGDTTTVLAASLVAFYHRARFGHVEAGLRTGDKARPFPEEINRRLADAMSDLFFCPTERSRQTLLAEGFPDSAIRLTANVRAPVMELLAGLSNVNLIEPLDYLSLVQLMKRSRLILTDSGGIQEEAPGLGIPVLVMRETTERPEGVDAGVVKLVGTD